MPLKKISSPLGSVPKRPLLVPIKTHRDVTRVPSSFWNVSLALTSRSLTLSKNSLIQFLRFCFPLRSWRPLARTTSSATNLSTASRSCAFHTSSHNRRTVSVDFMVQRSHFQRLTTRRLNHVHAHHW